MKEAARADSTRGPSHNNIILVLSFLSTGKSPKAENHGLSGRPQKQRAGCSGDVSLQEDEPSFPCFPFFQSLG